MTFIVKRMTAPCDDKEFMTEIMFHLTSSGYAPLIARAKQQLLSVFGKAAPVETILQELRAGPPTSTTESDSTWRMSSAILYGKQGLLRGDIFSSPRSKGLLYIRLERMPGLTISIIKGENVVSYSYQFAIGYLGDREEVECLNSFAELITEALKNQGKKVTWRPIHRSSDLFDNLLRSDEAQFASAETVSVEDAELAGKLENQDTREVAIAIKRAGGMLVDDVNKKVNKREDADEIIEGLVRTNLITREFVIICRRTSHQTNRVATRDIIDKMTEMGITCSCGGSIMDERIEELFLPTPRLEKLLKQSYWSTARLVYWIQKAGHN